MEIKQYTLEDKAEFEKVADLFQRQKEQGEIKPSIFKFKPYFFRPRESFVVAQNSDNHHVLGILNYSTVVPTQEGKLQEGVSIFPVSDRRFEYGFSEKFAFIHLLESFDSKNKVPRVGSKLLSEVKSRTNLAGICLIPSYSSRGFYLKNDFVMVDYLCNNNGFTAMLWKRDGIYL